jgi:nucleoside 2-deoxyribosyltransferase
MSELDDVKVFLSGAMDLVSDDGVGWRRDLIEKSKAAGLNLRFFDPTDKPGGVAPETGLEKYDIKKSLRDGDWQGAAKKSREVRHVDLRMIDKTDLYIVYIDTTLHACGTYNELFEAESQQKPLFAIMAPHHKKYDMPLWLIGIFREEEIFEGNDECIEYLKKINDGKVELDDRWLRITV